MAKLSDYKNWFKDFPSGQLVYQADESYTVDRSGIDFIVLIKNKDGSQLRITRNSVEAQQFYDRPNS